MRTSGGIRFVIIICLLHSGICDVIVRKVNEKTGSLCYLRDRSRGVCRRSCPGQRRNEYVENVCNPGESEVLYCCVDNNARQRYPTIQEVCLNRRLAEEFEQRGKDVADKLNEDLKNLETKFYQRIHSAVDWCEATAQTKSEDEKEHFLKHCKTIPQRPDLVIRSRHIGRRFENAHVAAIGLANPNQTITWMCSGTFIHPKYILTSAFCIITNEPNIVRVGPPSLNEEGIDFRISEVTVHSQHGLDGLYHDLAILKVRPNQVYEEPFEVIPACIWTKGDPPRGLMVMGYWGLSVRPEVRGGYFHGNISFISPTECNAQESFHSALPYGIIDSQVCARESATDDNSCVGELGGILHFLDDGWLKLPYIVGVGSFGASCLDGEPSVYTLLSPYLDWIERVISES